MLPLVDWDEKKTQMRKQGKEVATKQVSEIDIYCCVMAGLQSTVPKEILGKNSE